MVYFSLNILREHQVGWSSFRLTTGHFSVIENTLNSVLFCFNYYRVLPLERLRVFSSSSREELREQRGQFQTHKASQQ